MINSFIKLMVDIHDPLYCYTGHCANALTGQSMNHNEIAVP